MSGERERERNARDFLQLELPNSELPQEFLN